MGGMKTIISGTWKEKKNGGVRVVGTTGKRDWRRSNFGRRGSFYF